MTSYVHGHFLRLTCNIRTGPPSFATMEGSIYIVKLPLRLWCGDGVGFAALMGPSEVIPVRLWCGEGVGFATLMEPSEVIPVRLWCGERVGFATLMGPAKVTSEVMVWRWGRL